MSKGRKQPDRPGVFARFLALLHHTPDEAGRVYTAIHGRLAKFFESNNCPDPTGLADQVLDVVMQKVESGDVRELRNPGGYAYRIAENVLKSARGRLAPGPLPDNLAAAGLPPDAQPDPSDEVPLDCMEDCVSRLPAADRRLILRYEASPPSRKKIKNVRKRLAATLGIPVERLRRRAFEIRERLSACVVECMARQGT